LAKSKTESLQKRRYGRLALLGAFWLSAYFTTVVSITPDYPQYHRDVIFYPLLVVARSLAHHLIVPLVIAGLTLYGLTAIAKSRWRLLAILFAPLQCVWIAWAVLNALFVPTYTHIDTIQFDKHTYHLGYSYGAEPGLDYNLHDFIVYECQFAGLVCRHVGQSFAIWPEDHPQTRQTAGIEVQNDRLFVRIDEERREVDVD
jgi:hypothetical protein